MMTAPIVQTPRRRLFDNTPRTRLFEENEVSRVEIINILISIANSIINVAEILRDYQPR